MFSPLKMRFQYLVCYCVYSYVYLNFFYNENITIDIYEYFKNCYFVLIRGIKIQEKQTINIIFHNI